MSGGGRRGALIPFEAGGGVMMALIVAAMAFLACFALAAALSASRVASAWTDGLAGAATVRIAHIEGENAQRLGVVLDILNSSDGVVKAEPLSEEQVADLLAPWFGAAPELAELPAPAIVAVTVDPEDEPDAAIVQARLDGAVAGAVYDDHGRWRGRAADAAKSVRAVALGALAAAALAIAAVVVLAVRTGLAAQRHVIAALRLAGAEDRYVAGLYQKRFFWLGAIGGALGVGLAILAFLGFDAASRVTGALPALSPPEAWPLAALGVALFTALVAVLAARVSVFATLRRAP